MASTGKIYFISDIHLGLYPPEKSAVREKILVDWLQGISGDATELYMLGDIFDFWHEYKHVIPKGFTRFLGKLAELSDKGIMLHYFTGNHDIWVYDYLPSEIGLRVYRHHIQREINGKKFFIGHGDGIGRGDRGYKLMKWGFTNKTLQWLFARIHPNTAMAFGKRWSKSSRYAKGLIAERFRGEDSELQVMFAKEILQSAHFDYFIFGHRHTPFDIKLQKSRILNLGDWISHFTYAVWDGKELELHSIYPEREKEIYRNE